LKGGVDTAKDGRADNIIVFRNLDVGGMGQLKTPRGEGDFHNPYRPIIRKE